VEFTGKSAHGYVNQQFWYEPQISIRPYTSSYHIESSAANLPPGITLHSPDYGPHALRGIPQTAGEFEATLEVSVQEEDKTNPWGSTNPWEYPPLPPTNYASATQKLKIKIFPEIPIVERDLIHYLFGDEQDRLQELYRDLPFTEMPLFSESTNKTLAGPWYLEDRDPDYLVLKTTGIFLPNLYQIPMTITMTIDTRPKNDKPANQQARVSFELEGYSVNPDFSYTPRDFREINAVYEGPDLSNLTLNMEETNHSHWKEPQNINLLQENASQFLEDFKTGQ
jgi:hypothetical protein